jgi:hypothetical protein
MIVCPRCRTQNTRWERRCKACWRRFDAALLAGGKAAVESLGVEAGGTPGVRENPQHQMLAQLLGVEVQHVRALADAGIHTLEHIAESRPHQIGQALQAWTHIDPAALISRARQLLHIEPAREDEAQPKGQTKSQTPPPVPDPAEWWKMT